MVFKTGKDNSFSELSFFSFVVFDITLLRHKDIIFFTSSISIVCNGNKYSKEMVNF